jgi:hypothetical protein
MSLLPYEKFESGENSKCDLAKKLAVLGHQEHLRMEGVAFDLITI